MHFKCRTEARPRLEGSSIQVLEGGGASSKTCRVFCIVYCIVQENLYAVLRHSQNLEDVLYCILCST